MNENQRFHKTWLKWAVISGVATFATTILIIMLGIGMDYVTSFGISILVSIGILILAFREFKASNGGKMKYGHGVGMSALIGLVGGLIAGALLAFYIGIIHPGIIEDIRKGQVEFFVNQKEKGILDWDEDTIIENVESGTTVSGTVKEYLWSSPVTGLISMALLGLVVSAIMKQDSLKGTMMI
ncbi:MAG: DUF4199 domain-containing protein [Bacteroidia bacterium]